MEPLPPAPVIPLRETPPSPAPTPPPRPITPAAQRRIWTEPRVRRWWLLGLLILLIFSAYAGDRLWARHVEARLIQSGLLVKAKIIAADNKVGTMPIGPTDRMQLELATTGEHLEGFLSTNSALGNEVTVHLDPADHSIWTDRTQPTPLLDSMLIGMLMLPMVPVVLLVGYLQMRTLLNTWQNGAGVPAVIFDRKQSPIAPMSYALRCSLPNNRKKELFTVFVPRLGYGLEKGDLIWVITPPKKGRPLAVLWMAGGSV